MMDKLIIAVYVLTTSGGLVLLKLGSHGLTYVSIVNGKIVWNLSILTFFGIFSYGISFLLYILLISKFSLGLIVPLTTALVYILIFIASFVIFKETFTTLKIIAISMIIFGVIMLSLNK